MKKHFIPSKTVDSMLDSTVHNDEVARFSALAAEWWDPEGKMSVLHKFNPVRLVYIRDHICQRFARNPAGVRPLEGLCILDIGCGGGLLCEPMARLGAHVVGVDPSSNNIQTAKSHADQNLNIDYRCTTVENLVKEGECFDIVLNMEVIEHVVNVPLFLQSCANMIKPGGIMLLATINRTLKAYLLAIVGAEYILGWLPRGCHDWQKFITPAELHTYLAGHGLISKDLMGVVYHPFADEWRLSEDADVNYIISALRD